jgi:predicted nucleic acid-binding protein
VKLIVPEPGATAVAAIWRNSDRRISSLILYPEARAAIGRAERMGRLERTHSTRARGRFEALWAALDTIEVTDILARRAGDLAERHGLRAYDAVHLASVEYIDDSDTTLVSADGELLDAASDLGLATASVV